MKLDPSFLIVSMIFLKRLEKLQENICFKFPKKKTVTVDINKKLKNDYK